MALAVAKTESVELEALLLRDRRGGGGVDAAAQKNNSVCARHSRYLGTLVPSIG